MVRYWRLLAIPLVAAAASASAQPDSSDSARVFPLRMLAAHNAVRAAAGVAPLQWDEKLGIEAAHYAVTLALSRRLYHSQASTRPNIGENLWMGTRGAFSLEAMVSGWSSERSLFVPGRFPSVSRSGSWHDVGHYTQMIWPTTQKVGCALASTRDNDVLVCRYFPAGNVIGQLTSR